jgi:SNF2 family DNA or RNA helicase
MRKIADLQTQLQPHQQRVLDRLREQPGLVVAHGLGSGKSLSGLAVSEDTGGTAKIVVPAALQANYKKEIGKHVVNPRADYQVSSLQREALAPKDADRPHVNTLIVDEAHRLRDPGSKAQGAIKRIPADKRVLLTGSPLYNRPFDMASLVNIAADAPVFPSNQADFDRRYVGARTVDPGWWARNIRGVRPGSVPVLKNEKELGENLRKWVDYHENTQEGFPQRVEENVEVPFSPEQKRIYDTVMDNAPSWVKYKVREGLPPSKQESKDLNAFLSAARQVSVTPGGFQEGISPEQAAMSSPKLQKAMERLLAARKANPDHRAVVYSNFLDAGIAPYESLLQKNQIPYGKFTGEMPKSERDQLVLGYNEGKVPVLLLSSAGGEGLDLKGTRQMQILDPHFNKEKIEQVIGRGIRYKSHEHLPEDQRRVNVERYYSVENEPSLLGRLVGKKRRGSVDEYLRQLSNDKDQLNQQVRELLKQKKDGE